ncbi:MAG: hypothetical protein IT449_18950 [Phycisphaerales bacterium]|nr:hypothetical protein [Phycisphaerales bacterium]
MNAQALSFLIPFALGSSLTLAIVLIFLGWRGRLLGGGPRCRRCQYNLIGVTSGTCPECGLDLLAEHVQTGERRRRPVMMASGAILLAPTLLGGGGMLYLAGTQIKLDPYLPASWLIGSAAAGSDDAFSELLARLNNNTLSDGALRQLAEAALVKHGLSPAPSRWAEWCDTLAKIEQRKLLTPAQAEQFYTQLFIFELKARSPIRQGDPVVYEVYYKNRTSEVLPYSYLFEITEAALGGVKGVESSDEFGRTLFLNTDWSWQGRDPDRLEESGMSSTLRLEASPGKQPLRIAGRVALQPEDSSMTWSGESAIAASKEILLAAEVDVLPKDAPDPVEGVSSPEVDAKVRASVSRTAFAIVEEDRGRRREPNADGAGRYRIGVDWFSGPSRNGSVPVTCAFQVIVVLDDGTEHRDGTMGLGPGGGSSRSYDGTGFKVPEDGTVDVILRSDKELARETMDVFKIWDGEIRIEDVKVKDTSDEE